MLEVRGSKRCMCASTVGCSFQEMEEGEEDGRHRGEGVKVSLDKQGQAVSHKSFQDLWRNQILLQVQSEAIKEFLTKVI